MQIPQLLRGMLQPIAMKVRTRIGEGKGEVKKGWMRISV
jgi:hypothetical protein